ncbi:ribosomal protein L46, putative [Babesia ovis]|uniref:Ribosomal protein L46, putative n=1 Tax=Babesia ovis TaxID=5869 RepID=A0A9W5T9M6_BABOV|nr:ribosomal protein L46, putative [Babesia ovis]
MLRCVARFANTRSLTEHCGWKVQIALCVDRQPTEYVESPKERAFREFYEAWSTVTRNQVKVPRLSTIESKITHKITPSKEQRVLKSDVDTEPSVETSGELDALLASEIQLLPTRRRAKKGDQEVKKVEKVNVDGDVRNVERLPKKWLFYAVKHKVDGWKLPTTDLYHGDGLRQTLERICKEQIGESYSPYFLGYAPFLHRTYTFQSSETQKEIKGNKVFYFRARHLPGTDLETLTEQGDIIDYAWCTLDELADKVNDHKLIQALPLVNYGEE